MPRVVLFTGVPRSGTTVTFESLSHHEEVAWLPAQWRILRGAPLTGLYFRAFSNRAWQHIGYKRQPGQEPGGSLVRRFIPWSSEGYGFWQRRFSADIARDFLLGREPSPAEASDARAWVASYLRWAGKSCFIHKFTGPVRIQFLHCVFPEATFVHLVRDPIAVVRSLLNVPFWEAGEGADRPWWNGIPERYLEVHRERPVPEVLAAAQWKAIVETARQEAQLLPDGRYLEVRYSDFVSDPSGVVNDVLDGIGLGPSRRVSDAVARRSIRDRNADPRTALEPCVQANIEWALSRL